VKKVFIYANYCRGGHSDRNYFKDDNGKCIDAMRSQIEAWKDEEDIEDDVTFICSPRY